MDDNTIVDLYWERSELAIRETEFKYGKLLHHIAGNVLRNHADAEECVNDTYLGAWHAMPPARPSILPSYLSRITRNLALKKHEYIHAAKRNPNVEVSFTELEDCIAANPKNTSLTDDLLADAINSFLETLDRDSRIVFIRRYWYFDSIKDIIPRCNMSKSKVESMLFRVRNKLRLHLLKEGF